MRYAASALIMLLIAACGNDPSGPSGINVSFQMRRDGDYCVRAWTASAEVEADYQYEVQAPGGGVGAPTWAGSFRKSVLEED